MERDSVKWLLAGLAGALLCLILISSGVFFIGRYAMEELKRFRELAGEESEPSYGPDAWRERAERQKRQDAERQALLEASGLLDRYTLVFVHDDTRDLLYRDKNFDEVERRLADQFASADTPLRKLRYSQHIDAIGGITYDDEPSALWDTLNEWVAHSPESHLPRLIRGEYAIAYAWYFRGNTLANRVTDEGWEGFRTYLDHAQEDLEEAHAMNPEDPEASCAMITVAVANNLGFDVMEEYYRMTLAIDPLHRQARMAKVNFVQPKWGGSWREVEKVIEDARANRDAFPMMANVVRVGESYMASRGERYEGTWRSDETKRMMYLAYRDQAAASPDDLFVQGELAYWAADARNFGESARAFEVVGDRFPHSNSFGDLPAYNKWRAIVYAEHAQEDEVRGTPREDDLFGQAIELEASDPTVSGLYLAYLVRKRDDGLTRAFHENLKDPYLDTGGWGDPIDYVQMDAMARASRSDDWGVKDSELERELLDQALELAPDNALVRLVYAEYHISARDFEDARIHLEKARALDPGYLPALHIMGWLSYHQKRWDEGIDYANQFLASGPSYYLETFADDAREIIEHCEEKRDEATSGEDG